MGKEKSGHIDVFVGGSFTRVGNDAARNRHGDAVVDAAEKLAGKGKVPAIRLVKPPDPAAKAVKPAGSVEAPEEDNDDDDDNEDEGGADEDAEKAKAAAKKKAAAEKAKG